MQMTLWFGLYSMVAIPLKIKVSVVKFSVGWNFQGNIWLWHPQCV